MKLFFAIASLILLTVSMVAGVAAFFIGLWQLSPALFVAVVGLCGFCASCALLGPLIEWVDDLYRVKKIKVKR